MKIPKRGVFFMEGTTRKTRSHILFFVLALLLVIALAVGIFFMIGSGRNKEPSRGTYVMARYAEVSRT